MSRWIELSDVAGHLLITPPVKKGCAASALCAIKNLRLKVIREGGSTPIAIYPAQLVDGLWDFPLDESWRDAPPGLYVAETWCCDTCIGRHKLRKRRPCLGDATVLDIKAPMCGDALPEPEACCPEPTPAPCNYENPSCCDTECPVATVLLPVPNCTMNTIPCNPCDRPESKTC